MNKLLSKLTKQILFHESRGVSKVRLAKTIYIVCKGLVQQGICDYKEMEFIRMPLGPVPNHFDLLSKDPDIIVKSLPIGLSYNKKNYTLISRNIKKESYFNNISELLNGLKNVGTSSMVKYTHEEPSWKNHTNGSIYKINVADLRRNLPQPLSSIIDANYDDQKLQGLLLSGMIDEIVEESTSLEYPEYISEEND